MPFVIGETSPAAERPWDFLFAGALLLAVLPIFCNFNVGYAENMDSLAIVERASEFVQHGRFLPSRSWGYPVYELLVYPLVGRGWYTAGKIFSLVWVFITLRTTFVFVQREKVNRTLGAVAVVAVGWMPCTLISGNTILETAQSTALALLSVFWMVRSLSNARAHSRDSWIAYAFCALAIGSRPDHIIEWAAFTFTLFLFRPESRRSILVAAAVGLSVSIGFFQILYSEPLVSVTRLVDTGDDPAIRAAKWLIEFVAILGVPAWVGATIYGVRIYRRDNRSHVQTVSRVIDYFKGRPADFLYFLVTAGYFVRIALLPDELEYAYFWSVYTVVWSLSKNRRIAFAIPFAFLLALPSVVQIHLFARDPIGRVRWSPGLDPGALVQDRDGRRRMDYFSGPLLAAADREWRRAQCTGEPPRSADFLAENFPNDALPDGACEFASVKWYARFRDRGVAARGQSIREFSTLQNKTLFLHDFPTDRGWRRLLKFEPLIQVSEEAIKFSRRPPHSAVGEARDLCFWTGEACPP